MKSQGFYPLDIKDGIGPLKGSFAGSSDCTIVPITHKPSNRVYSVMVIFPKSNNWSSLEAQYSNLKSMLIQKYGEPASCTEKFKTNFQPEDNTLKMNYLQMDKCTFSTIFITPKGDISLMLIHQDGFGSTSALLYVDSINNQAATTNAIDDL